MNINNFPRYPWLASAMSFVLPGFGQLYNGEPNKAIWLFLSFILICAPGIAFIALYMPATWMTPILALSLLLTLSIWVYGIVEAWQTAHHKQSHQLHSWQISSTYTLVFLLCLIIQLVAINYVRNHQVQAFHIPSSSMEPGILQGDILFADMRYNCPSCKSSIQHGDVAIFVYPNNRTLYYIKRVIALPRDVVRIEGQSVWVNNKLLTLGQSTPLATEVFNNRQWQVQWINSEDNKSTSMSITVPDGQALVLGDNRNASKDTRHFGTVPLLDIVGKARQIWFSATLKDGVRWERLGKVIH
ncbi:MAG: signal peptidase I [Methylococcales bacterium]|nr:signal peptidase I [Methylococcales bacterium]